MPSRFLDEIDARYIENLNCSPNNKINKRTSNKTTGNKTKGKRFAPGDKVMHGRFGMGTVIAIDGEGDDSKLTIAFEQGGIKKFLASLAPLKKI